MCAHIYCQKMTTRSNPILSQHESKAHTHTNHSRCWIECSQHTKAPAPAQAHHHTDSQHAESKGNGRQHTHFEHVRRSEHPFRRTILVIIVPLFGWCEESRPGLPRIDVVHRFLVFAAVPPSFAATIAIARLLGSQQQLHSACFGRPRKARQLDLFTDQPAASSWVQPDSWIGGKIVKRQKLRWLQRPRRLRSRLRALHAESHRLEGRAPHQAELKHMIIRSHRQCIPTFGIFRTSGQRASGAELGTNLQAFSCAHST
mmetsp:Transcript_8791/g.25291  ORF Transcript_8791/g.25291 Transcript_8791/m.25291 type:complete len:258 (-) Transcript_8791:34-807(-)